MGTAAEPIEVKCPSCNGAGDDCKHCDDGFFVVDGCPNRFCCDMDQTVHMAELFNRGMPPVAGGALDQSASFLEAERCIRIEDALAKAELYE
jgi:hypothetical protein